MKSFIALVMLFGATTACAGETSTEEEATGTNEAALRVCSTDTDWTVLTQQYHCAHLF